MPRAEMAFSVAMALSSDRASGPPMTAVSAESAAAA